MLGKGQVVGRDSPIAPRSLSPADYRPSRRRGESCEWCRGRSIEEEEPGSGPCDRSTSLAHPGDLGEKSGGGPP